MSRYKFRAECLHDIIQLMERVPLLNVKIVKPDIIPDCTAEITTDLSIADIKNVMREIEDSHVMIETITPISKYTGERKGDA